MLPKISSVPNFKRNVLGHDRDYYLKEANIYLKRANEQQQNNKFSKAEKLFIEAQDTLNKILPTERNEQVIDCLAQAYLGQSEVLCKLEPFEEERIRIVYGKASPYRSHEVEQRLANLQRRLSTSVTPAQPRGQHTVAAVYGYTIQHALSSPSQTQAAVFFKQDVSPVTNKQYQVEEDIAKLQDTRHLAYCLQQATLNEEQKKPLTELAAKIADLFAGRATKTLSIVQEIAPLATIPNPDIYQSLLNQALKTLEEPLLNANVVQGLAVMIRYCPGKLVEEGKLSSSDLMDGLKLLLKRLQSAYQHDKDTTRLQTLLQAHTQLLEAMALMGVTGISRVQVQEPLKEILCKLSGHSSFTIQFQARYARQALAHIPNDESTSQAVLRRMASVTKGVLTLASAVKTLDPAKLLETFEHFSEVFSGAEEITKELISLAKEMYEAGSTVQKGGTEIREGMDFNRRHRWYAALQATDILLAEGQFSQLEVFVRNSPYWQHADFLQGLCQRLEQIARSHQDELIQRAAVDFLGDLIQNPAQWKSHSDVKQSASYALERLAIALTGTVQTRVQEILKQSNPNWVPAGHTGQNYVPPVWASIWHEGQSSQLLSEARGDLAHFKRQQEIELRSKKEPLAILGKNIEAEYFTAWENAGGEIQEGLAMYVAPQATTVTDRNTLFDLNEAVTAFLTQKEDSGVKTQVLLLRGEAGSGKSTFNRQLARRLWREYSVAPASDERPIPLYIALPTVDKPHQNLIGQYLSDKCSFSPEQIDALRQSQRFILILDGYDEIPAEQRNLYADEKLDQWQAKIILSCRPEYLTEGYKNHLQPRGHLRLLLEYQLAPFSEPLIDTYIDQYVKHMHVEWSASKYKNILRRMPNINALLGTPFLLKMALSVLPTLDRAQSDQVGLTRIQLYEKFVRKWFKRALNRLKLMQHKLTDAQQKAFGSLTDANEFIGHSQKFNTDFAVAMAEAKTTVAEYSAIAHRGMPQDKRYEPFLSSKDEEKNLLRFSALLTRQQQKYRFIHKSIQDYLVARAVWEELENASGRDASSGTEPLNEIKNVRLIWETLDPSIQVDPTALLNQFNLVEELAVQRFLVERVQQNRALVKLLLTWIKASTSQDTVNTAAANAITILVKAGVQFNGMDLQGIQIPGADLSFGVFDSAQLQGADLSNVNLRNSWLRAANLSGAQMAEVQFGEWPYLREAGEVLSCAYSPDGKTCAIGLGNGEISVYDTSTWKKIYTLGAHDNAVLSVVYSPSGQQIASGSKDKTVQLWDAQTGARGRTLTGHTGSVLSVAYSRSGQRIASGSVDKTVRLWDVQTGKSGPPLTGHTGSVLSVVYSPNGQQIASGSDDKTVRLWDVQTGKSGPPLTGHTDSVSSVAYSPSDGQQIASGSKDKTVRLWDVQTGKSGRTLTGHKDSVLSVVYSPNGQQIASGSDDKTVRLWDAQTGALGYTMKGHTDWVRSVVYSPSGHQIASGSDDKTVRLWDTQTSVPGHTLQGHTDSVWSVMYSPGGEQIASGSRDKTVRLWDTQTGAHGHILQGHTDRVWSVVYSPSGKQIASGSDDHTVRLWDTQTGAPGRILTGHTDWVRSVVYSLPSGEQIASASDDKTVRLWDVQTGKSIHTLTEHTDSVSSVAYSPKGDQIASGSKDTTVRLWDAQTGSLRRILRGHTDLVSSVAYSPSGEQIASGSRDKTVRLWDAQTEESDHTLEEHTDSVSSVAYSPKGDQIASGSKDKTVRLWDAQTGSLRHILRGYTDLVSSVAYSPSGEQIASGSRDKTVRLWDAQIEESDHTLEEHTDSVSSVAYSPSDEQIASGSDDKTVRLWGAQTDFSRLTLKKHKDSVSSVVYSPSGEQIASGSDDTTVRLWEIKTGKCLAVVPGLGGAIRSVAWKKTPDGLCLAIGCDDKSVRQWQIIEEEGHYQVRLCWSSMHDRLTVSNISIQNVQGLSQVNTLLLQQRGAVGEPSLRSCEVSQELIADPTFRQVSSSGSLDSLAAAEPNPPAGQSAQPALSENDRIVVSDLV
ncbi:NACHT domain-containing protein [Mycoavidus sp. SF9855]|uniref:WD40 domain-containing protein n=1 Tax=Mycoavidus sp. SF9855 TaxID=2968475 RepID=UPI00211BC6BD|nr:NACHT domain-containing protein [Mycoavidus sp. SF9855]UUM21565.1 NACHT domain-containing protein [Mycoavidus sp. SF9855]